MATKLTGSKIVRREVQGTMSERLIVALTSAGVTVREKGRRTTYGPLPYAWLYLQGAKMMAEARMKEKRAGRKFRAKRSGI